jgi:phosphoglycolate phosphatase
MYKLIVFDWDGTLMDSAQKIADCIIDSALDVGLRPPSEQQAKSIIGLGLVEAMHILFPNGSTKTIDKMIERYRYHFINANQTPQSLFKGVEQGLAKLYNEGVFLAVATGKSRSGLDRALASLSIAKYFVASRCGDETRSKPNPQMLMELLEYTAIDPINTVMVGDTVYDMQMASNAGVDGLAVSYGVHSSSQLKTANPIGILNSFDEVCQWLINNRIQTAY